MYVYIYIYIYMELYIQNWIESSFGYAKSIDISFEITCWRTMYIHLDTDGEKMWIANVATDKKIAHVWYRYMCSGNPICSNSLW